MGRAGRVAAGLAAGALTIGASLAGNSAAHATTAQPTAVVHPDGQGAHLHPWNYHGGTDSQITYYREVSPGGSVRECFYNYHAVGTLRSYVLHSTLNGVTNPKNVFPPSNGHYCTQYHTDKSKIEFQYRSRASGMLYDGWVGSTGASDQNPNP